MPARRVVTLTCSHTEIVAALGCGDLLVGCDVDSDHPPELVRDLPRVGRDLGVDPAKVAALDPDLVLASLTVPGHEEVVARLERAGLPFVVTQPISLADVLADIRLVARELGVVERGEALAAALEAQLVPRRRPDGRRPGVLVSWWPKPVIGAARRSWVHDLIELAGGHNVLAAHDVESQPLGDEEIVALSPEHVVLSWCGVPLHRYRPELVLANPALAALPAVREQQVHAIPEAWLGRPGPRLLEGYRALCEILGTA